MQKKISHTKKFDDQPTHQKHNTNNFSLVYKSHLRRQDVKRKNEKPTANSNKEEPGEC